MESAVAKRSPKEVIDDAIADNRWWERTCFALVVLFVASGLTTLTVGIMKEKDTLAVTGGGITALFLPAMWFARGLRERNMRIRASEIPFALAKTTEEARAIWRDTFEKGKGS